MGTNPGNPAMHTIIFVAACLIIIHFAEHSLPPWIEAIDNLLDWAFRPRCRASKPKVYGWPERLWIREKPLFW